ncbi:MAG: LysR substrate-binding domain-containing protein [Candidatus Methylomirabilis sp.]|nr:LysR substrate-binding domain-containing protein [Candidatus Methylomirabilis sp.]
MLSQPAVSAQVRELERTLDATFFERVGRTIVLTEAGRELLPYAERICTLTDEARLAMQELDGLKRGRIAVAAVSTAGAYVLPSLLGAFQRQYPGITINLEVTNRALARDRLVHNEVDLVVMGRPRGGPARGRTVSLRRDRRRRGPIASACRGQADSR